MNEIFLSRENVKINLYQHRGVHRYLHLKWLLPKSFLQLLLLMCLRTLLVSNSSTMCGELVLCCSETLPRRVRWPPPPWSDTSQFIQESECHNLSGEKKATVPAWCYFILKSTHMLWITSIWALGIKNFKEWSGHKVIESALYRGLGTRAIRAFFPIPQNNVSRTKHLYIT